LAGLFGEALPPGPYASIWKAPDGTEPWISGFFSRKAPMLAPAGVVEMPPAALATTKRRRTSLDAVVGGRRSDPAPRPDASLGVFVRRVKSLTGRRAAASNKDGWQSLLAAAAAAAAVVVVAVLEVMADEANVRTWIVTSRRPVQICSKKPHDTTTTTTRRTRRAAPTIALVPRLDSPS
jgi:hypothetical protein